MHLNISRNHVLYFFYASIAYPVIELFLRFVGEDQAALWKAVIVLCYAYAAAFTFMMVFVAYVLKVSRANITIEKPVNNHHEIAVTYLFMTAVVDNFIAGNTWAMVMLCIIGGSYVITFREIFSTNSR